MYRKLTEFGKSFLWLLGALIITAQVYRIVAFYVFNVEMEISLNRDIPLAAFGIALMYVQSGLKTFARAILAKIGNVFVSQKK